MWERVEAVAHQAYLDIQDWRAALEMWAAYAEATPPTIETQLALAHCRIEMAPADELPTIGIESPSATSNGKRELYLFMIRARAFAHLQAGDAARAAYLMRLVAVGDPHTRGVYGAILPANEPTLTRLPEPTARDAPLPFEQAIPLDRQAVRAVLERHRHRRVLLVIRGGDAPTVLDLPRCITASMTALGIPWHALNAGATMSRAAFIEELRRALDEVRPELIVYDDMFVSGPAGEVEHWTAILEILHAARRATGAKLVFTHPDAWYDGMADLYETAYNLGDLFHMPHPTLLGRLSPAAAGRVFCYPYPAIDHRPPASAKPPTQLRGAFVGSANWTSLSRLVWAVEIAHGRLPVDSFLGTRHGRSAADYAALIGDYTFGINFTARSNGARILTGRTVEIPLFGSLLLEEDSADTPYFMRPYEHYVPFATVRELEARLCQLIEEPALRQRIQTAGSAWAREHFGGLHFWGRLYHCLYETPVHPVPPPQPKFVTIDIPGPPAAVVPYLQRLGGGASGG